MLGIKQLGQIAEGHFKEITKQEDELYESRIKICKQCPLYDNSGLREKCSAKKCWNTKTNNIEYAPGPDIICGCNCYLGSKLRVKNAECVLHKWK